MRMAEKSLLLQFLDHIWKDHLLQLDHLRQGINLRAYAQRDPLNEYKREAFELFEEMLVSLREQVTSALSHVEFRAEPPPTDPLLMEPPAEPVSFGGLSYSETLTGEPEPEFAEAEVTSPARGGSNGAGGAARTRARRRGNGNAAGNPERREREPAGDRLAAPRPPWAGTPRNAICPCGSGKKFKHCHGRI
jgi:preprotein translocase subunit SecA